MSDATTTTASLMRRFAAMVYEAFLIVAICFFAMAAFTAAASRPGEPFVVEGWLRQLFWLFLFLVTGLYFSWCWLRGGQTLPMKTWKIRLESADGRPLSAIQVAIRYCAAWVSLLLGGGGFFWAAFDADHQFLHDRIAGTRIVRSG